MKLTGELKKKVEKAETREAARETIEKAGMLLSDEEMDQVAGGWPGTTIPTIFDDQPVHACPDCGEPQIHEFGRGWYCPKCEKKP